MFGRKEVASATADARDSVSPYIDQLAHDEKLRERLTAAITAGMAARQRARKQVGLIAVATRLGTDPVLRAQVTEAFTQLQKAKGRIEKNRSHKKRNVLLFITGAGIVVAAVPSLRDAVMSKVRGEDESTYNGTPVVTTSEPVTQVDSSNS